MTTLNTIIEEEKKEFDKRFMQDGELLTAFDGKDDASDIKSHLTTAMQRAYEAGKDERDTYWKERVEEAYEWGVKQTIAQFLRMNIENPKAPVNIDEVKRRALSERV